MSNQNKSQQQSNYQPKNSQSFSSMQLNQKSLQQDLQCLSSSSNQSYNTQINAILNDPFKNTTNNLLSILQKKVKQLQDKYACLNSKMKCKLELQKNKIISRGPADRFAINAQISEKILTLSKQNLSKSNPLVQNIDVSEENYYKLQFNRQKQIVLKLSQPLENKQKKVIKQQQNQFQINQKKSFNQQLLNEKQNIEIIKNQAESQLFEVGNQNQADNNQTSQVNHIAPQVVNQQLAFTNFKQKEQQIQVTKIDDNGYPLILRSLIHQIVTLKQSFQNIHSQFSYQLLNSMMPTFNIDWKNCFPNIRSTQEEVQNYGKKLFKLFQIQHLFDKNQIIINDTFIAYLFQAQLSTTKINQNRNFVLICYFSLKIYLGQYQVQKNYKLNKHGFGIQIKQKMYIYFGSFFQNQKDTYQKMSSTKFNQQSQKFLQISCLKLQKNQETSIYIGQFSKGFKQGLGKQTNIKEEFYVGNYQHGHKNGHGLLKYNNNCFYQGQFLNDLKKGKGVQKFKSGDVYKGQYDQNKFNGKGQYCWQNGTIFRGSFLNGLKDGIGIYQFSNGQKVIKNYIKNSQIGIAQDYQQKANKKDQLIQTSQHRKKNNFKHQRTEIISNSNIIKFNNKRKIQKKLQQLNYANKIQEDFKNLNQILQHQQLTSKIFNFKDKNNIMGEMYAQTQRPMSKTHYQALKINKLKISKKIKQKLYIQFDKKQKITSLFGIDNKNRVQSPSKFEQF